MRAFVLSLLVIAGVQANAIELGKYAAVDAETKSIVANFELKAGGALTFSVKTTDGSVPQTNCTGTYSVAGNLFAASLVCQSQLLPKASVKIDISGINAQNLRSANGAPVAVTIDALGSDPTQFLLKKAD
jgi:hypothetical protein